MAQPAPEVLVRQPDDGDPLWHLDVLWTFKISTSATAGAFSLAEQLLPKGSAPPVHRHSREDEAWIVLDGEVTFWLDGSAHLAGPGTYVFGPRNRAHTFRVDSDTARMATLLVPGAAEEFFHATGRPADAPTLPPPGDPDLAALLSGMAEHGIEFLGPPPSNA